MYSINYCLTKKRHTMFTSENVKKMATTLVIVMVALAVHQKFVAPMIAGKKPVTPPTKA